MRKLFSFVLALSLSVPPSIALAQQQRRAPEIKSKVWFNASYYKKKPSLKSMRGKVVIVFFWTREDTHCETAALNLNKWYIKYRNKGLEIIGVHTPEWVFNQSQSELFNKIESLGLLFPVAVDNDSSIWDKYGSHGWPSFFLIDRDGYIRARYEGVFDLGGMHTMLEGLLEESGTLPRLRRSVEG